MMLGFLTFFLGLLTTNGWANPPLTETPYLDSIEAQIQSHAPKSVDEMLALLPPSMKKQFLMVYDSRSTQSASIDAPRVILTTPDHQFYLSFSGNLAAPDTSPDARLEIIEQYGLGESRFAEISFQNRQAQVNREPRNCVHCHRGSPIFDGYPHWPGFIASTHNGRAYGENSGSGRIARLEFEESALQRFIQNAPNHPRYRNLDLGTTSHPIDLAEMGRRNSIVGAAIIGGKHQRQSERVILNARSIQEIEDAFVLSKAMQDPENNVYLPSFLDPRYQFYRDFVNQASPAYEIRLNAAEQFKFDRLRSAVSRLGTETDKIRILQASVYNATDTYRADYLPYPAVRSDLGIPVANVMNYFGNRARFRFPGLYYEYLKNNYPALYPDELGTTLTHRSIRDITGATSANVLSSGILGYEDVNADGFSNARNYRDLTELYAWVTAPVKTIEWTDLQAYPILRDQLVQVQEAYLEIIDESPVFDLAGAERFRDLKSLSPENRLKLEGIIAKKSTPSP